MKRLLITMTVLMSFLLSTEPDPRGNWKLSGLSVDYLHIARETTSFYLTVDYPSLAGTSFASSSDCHSDAPTSICVELLEIPAGVMFNRLTNGPFTDAGLGGIGVNLNVNIYDGGNGTIAQGSFYPDIELSESQACVTDLQIFAVNENFSWEVGTQTTFSDSNVLGMSNGLLCDDDDPDTVAIECSGNTDEAWGFGLVTGLFDETPSTPVPVALPPGLPYVALTDGTILGASCQTALVGNACAALDPPISAADDADGCALALVMAGQLSATQDGSGPLEQAILQCELATNPAYGGTYAGSAAYGGAGWLHGTGTSSKFNLDTGNSTMCDGGWSPNCNPDVDFKLVWHALDSQETGLGFGDIDYPAEGWDEDGDGSEFDRIFGVPYIEVTHLNTDNALCDISGGTAEGNEFSLPVAGNILSTLGAEYGCDELTTYDAQYACGAGVVDQFITDGCYSGVVDAVTDTCNAAGGVANLVYLGCVEQATGEVATTCAGAVAQAQAGVAATCAAAAGADSGDAYDACYAGAIDAAESGAITAVIEGTCLAAGGPATSNPDVAGGLTCADLAGAYATAAGGDCSVAVGLATQSCTDSNGGSLCCLAGGIGVATTPTCDDFAASYDNDDLDAAFADTTGGVTCEAYGDNFVDWCLEDADGNYNGDNDTEMYLFQPGAGLDTWGDFMTYNGAVFSSLATQAATGLIPCGDATLDAADGTADGLAGLMDLNQDGDTDADDIPLLVGACNSYLLDDDSGHDFDPACMYDQDPSDCSGRLTMTFEPTCVPEIEARQIVAEFVDLTDLCNHSGDVDYSCAAYDWNYNYLADTDSDGISEADCSAFAAATGQAYVVNNGPVLPSCDDDITTNCTEYSATVVWNAAYNMCGDGDPNDLIDLGVHGFCGPAVAAGAFDAAATAPTDFGGAGCPTPDFVVDADGTTCAYATCMGFYTAQGGVPSFEQNCTVGDGNVTVTDVVRIINHIIGQDSTFGQSVDQLGGEAACEADVNDDGDINVVDVVAIVNGILSGNGRMADASEASISIENDKIVVSADGFIGAVDMIVEFTDNFSFDIADGFASTSRVNGNRAHIILIGDKDGISDVLTMTSGKIVSIEEVLVANSSDFVTTSINQPSTFSVGAAYPNPFNPSTNISLVLNANADLSVKVYNLTGQLVDVIAEGNFSPSSYNWTWKAENLASGVYFIKTQVGSEVSTQKVMLLK